MGGRSSVRSAGAARSLLEVRRREPAARATAAAGKPRAAGAADPRSGRVLGAPRNTGGARPALSLPALRRAHDGAAAWAHRPPPLLGVGDRPGAVSARAARPIARRDATAGLHLALGLRNSPLDDAVDMGRGDRAGTAVPACSTGASHGVTTDSDVACGSHALRHCVVRRWD